MKSRNAAHVREPKLIVEIAIVIACKLLFIFGLWYFFFSPEHRPDVTSDVVGSVMLGPSDSSQPSNDPTQ